MNRSDTLALLLEGGDGGGTSGDLVSDTAAAGIASAALVAAVSISASLAVDALAATTVPILMVAGKVIALTLG